MNPMIQDAPGREKRLDIKEVEKLLKRSAHPSVVDVIAGCSSLREQKRLIDLWNNPEDFEEFIQQAAGMSCAYAE